MPIKEVGVVGAGVMGRGLAQALAAAGLQAILIDVSEKILESAKTEIRVNLRFQPLFNKAKPAEAAGAVMERIEFSTSYERLARADFVIENVTEDWEIKKGVYRQLDPICREDCVFAANTSAIPITKLAALTSRPARTIGTHFMNPVPLKPVVEVIKGYHTSEETIRITQDLLAALGKEAIIVNDSPGFVSNRVLMVTINEAIFLVQEQVATAEEVDRLFKTCFGHKMGPLETADLIGLDTILLSIEVLFNEFNDSKYRPCPLLKKMVAAGLHGRKSGQGFYSY